MENLSNVDLFDVKVTDELPGNVTVLGISHNGVKDGNFITWSNIHLAKDGEDDDDLTLTFTVQVNENTGNGYILHNEVTAKSNDYDIEDSDTDDTRVERIPQIAGKTVVPVTPITVVPVPVTAKTGAGVLSILATLMGGAGLTLVTKKVW